MNDSFLVSYERHVSISKNPNKTYLKKQNKKTTTTIVYCVSSNQNSIKFYFCPFLSFTLKNSFILIDECTQTYRQCFCLQYLMGLSHGPTFSLQIANLVPDLGKLGWRSNLPFLGPCDSPNRAVFTPTTRLRIRPKISRQCLSVGRAIFCREASRVSPLN